MTKYRYHKDHTEPQNGEVFVFGSNRSGIHGAGAAKLAAHKYGASPGVGFGGCGRSYAIATKGLKIETLSLQEVKWGVQIFLWVAECNPQQEYFMTRVGCGLAGYKDSDIAPMFKGCPGNVIFPEEWKEFLED